MITQDNLNDFSQLPDDINLERRRKIMRGEIEHIFSKKERELKRLKNLEFAKKKRIRKLADRSRVKNR